MRLPITTFAILTLLIVLVADQPRAAAAGLFRAGTEAGTTLPMADDFAQLHDRFQRLHRSLQGKGGIGESDRELVRDMRDRFARFNAQNPNHEGGIAGELQLSLWLEDNDRANELFRQLVLTNPDHPQYGSAWLGFLERTGQSERVDETYNWLLHNTTNTTDLRIRRASHYKRQSDYPRALQLLSELDLDPALHADTLRLKAECLAAENRFDEAIAVIDQVLDHLRRGDSPMPTNAAQLQTQLERLRQDNRELAELWSQEMEIQSTEAAADDLPRVELITTRGRIVVELFEDSAPNTVANFITLVEEGFYDGTQFHRVEPEFVTQGGDPNTRPDADGLPGTGGPGYRIADEWERENARKHFAGSLAMAHSGPDTAGSQFYFTHRPTLHLNRGYTVFGRIIEGLDAARAMQIDDELTAARVLRKRDHEYAVDQLRPIEDIEQDLPEFLRTR